MDVLFQGRQVGRTLQTDVSLEENFEVKVRFENRDVFGQKLRKTRMLRTACAEWLDQYGGDWGMIHWELELDIAPDIYEKIGRVFQFGDRRTAQLFLLTWNCFKVPHRHVEEAS